MLKNKGLVCIGLLSLVLACNTPQSGMVKSQADNSEVLNKKNVKPVSLMSTVVLDEMEFPYYMENLYYDFSSLLPEPDETELGYPFKDVTLTFSGEDKYNVQAKDPKLFADDDVEVIDLFLIGAEEYSLPLKGARVVSRYAGKRARHAGIDLSGRSRDPIYSVFDGVVRVSKQSESYGNIIVVRHFNGLETVYSHNTKNMVKAGDRVKAGQQIAVSGRTGRASGDHLHFEVRMNGQHFNPELLFDFKKGELKDKSLYCVQTGNKIKVTQVDAFPSLLASHRAMDENDENHRS